ncbi:hypothetical protein BN10_560017 [Phycicoccus elongatus Lp2]|uniref:Uncharacterized protein n=1 Tax=Phycicoccus elongatus Lp2 TaxID=1193181 RepID=N0E567_9MICO|nr:hypothetical protein BN10_560017 [Phycicoccus elongatus Lp2]
MARRKFIDHREDRPPEGLGHFQTLGADAKDSARPYQCRTHSLSVWAAYRLVGRLTHDPSVNAKRKKRKACLAWRQQARGAERSVMPLSARAPRRMPSTIR